MQTQIKYRTKQIGLKIIKLIDDLPGKPSALIVAKQIIRSSTSIGANYRNEVLSIIVASINTAKNNLKS